MLNLKFNQTKKKICSLEVYTVDLQSFFDRDVAFFETLDNNERKRASAFKFDELKLRYITSHGILRFLLSRYLDIKPKEITFEQGAFGKPYISNQPFFFNMSHSKNMALYAFSQNSEVGVDVEHLDPRVSIEQLPVHIFQNKEPNSFRRLPIQMQKIAFYKKWTEMEAVLKARGTGLHNFCDFEFEKAKWAVHEIPISENYVGIVACSHQENPIQLFSKINK